MSNNKKPFDQKFVLDITAKHARMAVDLSINKTFERIPEFASDPKKSIEVFETLTKLHAMRKQIDAFQIITANS